MGETFLVYYPVSDRVLVAKGINRPGTWAAVNNHDKKDVTSVVTASPISSQLLPPFIIDSGGFGSTLMHQWKRLNNNIDRNPSHWITQYAFILYSKWH